jgi:hypothetical protein
MKRPWLALSAWRAELDNVELREPDPFDDLPITDVNVPVMALTTHDVGPGPAKASLIDPGGSGLYRADRVDVAPPPLRWWTKRVCSPIAL